MTATQVIAEIDRLPPEEQQAVFTHVRMMEEDSTPDSILKAMAEEECDELIVMGNGGMPARQLTGDRSAMARRIPSPQAQTLRRS